MTISIIICVLVRIEDNIEALNPFRPRSVPKSSFSAPALGANAYHR